MKLKTKTTGRPRKKLSLPGGKIKRAGGFFVAKNSFRNLTLVKFSSMLLWVAGTISALGVVAAFTIMAVENRNAAGPQVLGATIGQSLGSFENSRVKMNITFNGYSNGKADIRTSYQRTYTDDPLTTLGYRFRISLPNQTTARERLIYREARANGNQNSGSVLIPGQTYWVDYLKRFNDNGTTKLLRLGRVVVTIPAEDVAAGTASNLAPAPPLEPVVITPVENSTPNLRAPDALSCNSRNLNFSTSGLYDRQNGGARLATIKTNDPYYIKCDYGLITGFITTAGNGSQNCSWVGWDNTAAVFACQGLSPVQNAEVICQLSQNPYDNSCNAQTALASMNLTGNVSVRSPSSLVWESSYLGKNSDVTSNESLRPDGTKDAAVRVVYNGNERVNVTTVEIKGSNGGVWDTKPNSGHWLVKGVLDDTGGLLNTPNNSVNFSLGQGESFTVYFSDTANNYYIPTGSALTVTLSTDKGQVSFSPDGTSAPLSQSFSITYLRSPAPPLQPLTGQIPVGTIPSASPQPEYTSTNLVNFSSPNRHIEGSVKNPHGQPVVRFDTDGNAIDAHDGEIKQFDGIYYLYGTSYDCGFGYLNQYKTPFCGLKVYSSADLVHWTDEGYLFDPASWQNPCADIGCFRPHVAKNPSGQYVLWMNVGGSSGSDSGYRVFTGSSPTRFTYSNKPSNLARKSGGGDHNLFVDDDGTGYLLNTNYGIQTEHFKIYIEKLNADFTDGIGNVARAGRDEDGFATGEAPVIVKQNGNYFLAWDRACAYCTNGIARYNTAKSPLGPWTGNGTLLTNDTCGGQLAHIEKIGTTYLFMSDLWHQAEVGQNVYDGNYRNQGRANYYWGKVNLSGESMSLACEAVSVNPARGSGSQKAVSNLDQTSGVAGFSSACDIGSRGGQISRIQTFTASRSGNLTGVIFNTFKSGVVGGGEANADLDVKLVEMSGARPGAIMQTFRVPKNSVGYSLKEITLKPTVRVEAGREYGIWLSSNLSSSSNGCYGFGYNDGDVYKNGREFISTDGGATFSLEQGRALKFDTVVE